MKSNTIRYLFKEGIVGLWKNRLMALASVGTIILCLVILGMSYGVAENIEYVLEQVESQLGITAYIHEEISPERQIEIENAIKRIPNVKETKFISKEDALHIFADDQGNNDLFNQFQNDNPLPASFEVLVEGAEFQKDVVSKLEEIPELQVTYFEQETGLFIKINQSVKLISGVVIGCLIFIGLLLITNTIKLTVYVRRREINIMKYIGATDSFIRLPFVIEGISIGLIGALIPTFLTKMAYTWALEFMGVGMNQLLGGLSLLPTQQIMMDVIPMFFALGIGIGTLGSAIAIRKHLKV